MPTSLRVLIVNDSPDDADLMVLRLVEEGFQPDWRRVETEADYLAALETPPGLILADWSLLQLGGLRALQLMRWRGLDIPFVIVSGSIGEEAAVDALHHGAYDYVRQDRLTRLGPAARRALEEKRLRQERQRAEEAQRNKIAALQTLAEISREIIAATEPQKILDLVCRCAADLLRAPKASIAIATATGDTKIVAGYGLSDPARTDQEIARLWRSGDLRADGVSSTEANFHHAQAGGGAEPVARDKTAAYAYMPLIANQQTLGVLAVFDVAPRAWSKDELQVLNLLAGQTAIALDQARLFEAERQQRELADILRQVGAAMAAALSLDVILDLLLEQVNRIVPSDAVNVRLIKGEQAYYARWRGYERFGTGVLDGFSVPVADTRNLRQMVETGLPVITPDLRADPDWIPVPGLDWRSNIGVPIRQGSQTIGFLELDHAAPNFFTAKHAELLGTFADQAAIALENARLFQAERRQRELAETQREMGAALASTLDVEVVLDILLNQVNRVVPSDAANIMLIEPAHSDGGDVARAVRWRGYERFGAQDYIAALRFVLNETHTLRRMVETGRTIIVSDTYTEPNWIHYPETEWIRAYMATPIRARGQVIGFLNVNSAAPGFFEPAHAELLRAFADQAALALDNARLFKAEQRRAEQLAIIGRVAQAVSTTLNLAEIYQTVYQHVAEIVSCDTFILSLYDDQAQLIHPAFIMQDRQAEDVSKYPPLPFDSQDEGLPSQVIHTGQSLIMRDFLERTPGGARYAIGVPGPPYTRSAICVPLRAEGCVIGILQTQSYQVDAYRPDDIPLLEAVGAHVAAAMVNAQLYQAAQDQARRLVTLNEIGRAITSTLDLDRVLIVLLEGVRQVTQAEACSAALVEEGTGDLIFRQAVGGAGPAVAGLRLKVGQGIAGWVAQHGQPALVTDVASDPRFYGRVDDDTGFSTRDMVCVPLLARDSIIGVVELINNLQGCFNQDDVQLLESVAAQAAVAIENARLFEETRRQLDEMAIVSDVALAGASGQSSDDIVAYATQALSLLWPEAVVGFLFVDETGQSLRPHPSARGIPLEIIANVCIPLDHGITGWTVQAQQPVRAGDVAADPRYIDLGTGSRSEMAAPLVINERALGVVNVESPYLNAFSEADLRLLTTLASQLATLFEKARLDTELEAERALLARRVKERTAELSAANAELARANRLKDEFLANMSHELRTPLNAVLGMSEALQEQVFGLLNEKQLEMLGTISESGHHLLSLINDILDLSKIEAGKLQLQLDSVIVEMACQVALQFVKQVAYQKRIQVSLTLDENVSVFWADARRLKQILVNLLANAVKFTPEGGQVGLQVKGDTERAVVHFTVWDTGIGVAKEDLNVLFKPFVQLDSSLSRQYGGTGLGLSLVQRLAELHGGSVSVESKVGQGSRFTVSLPWQEGDKVTRKHEERESKREKEGETNHLVSQPHGLLVLLAEDNETNLDTISDYLLAKGYRVIVARDGKEAIQRAGEDQPGVILMDIQMPELDGLEAIRHIRALPPRAGKSRGGPSIIALTALAMPGDREQCLEAGADEYLSKPIGLKELTETIERLAKGR